MLTPKGKLTQEINNPSMQISGRSDTVPFGNWPEDLPDPDFPIELRDISLVGRPGAFDPRTTPGTIWDGDAGTAGSWSRFGAGKIGTMPPRDLARGRLVEPMQLKGEDEGRKAFASQQRWQSLVEFLRSPNAVTPLGAELKRYGPVQLRPNNFSGAILQKGVDTNNIAAQLRARGIRAEFADLADSPEVFDLATWLQRQK
jgi:hypothetical protein